MRTIKFRGQCVPDSKYAGEWVEGGYAPPNEDCKEQNEGLIVTFLGGNCSCSYHVIPETVGQYTGLKDKNDVEICEGDIVAWNRDELKYVVMFCNGSFYANVDMSNEPFFGFLLWYMCREEFRCTIIGNIHDNPELLENK